MIWGNMRFKKTVTLVLSFAISFTYSQQALALSNSWVCTLTGPAYDRYGCVAGYGYGGEDPYNMDRFSTVLADGTKHSCTSFAAYMLYYDNTYNAALGHFDSAQYWDTESVSMAGASLSLQPHIGDIAQWEASSPNRTEGHVAVVESIDYASNGSVNFIITVDDNSGLNYATKRKLYPGVTSGVIPWPHVFITFPGFTGHLGPLGGGGGKPPQMTSPIASPGQP